MSYHLTKQQIENMKPGNCTRCGTPCPNDRNSAGQCTACHNLGYDERKAARKEQLAAADRCECCDRRGTWKCSGVLLCGWHLKKVKHAHDRAASSMGGMALFCPVIFSREDVLKHAKGAER